MLPQVCDLQERFLVGRAFFEREMHSVELDHLLRDYRSVSIDRSLAEHSFQADKSLLSKLLASVIAKYKRCTQLV